MFIEDIGRGYANENLYGAHFIYEGKVHRLERIESHAVRALRLEDFGLVELPVNIITGWRTFKYPRLGYRRINDTVVGTVSRSPRSYTRGLSAENLVFTPSPRVRSQVFEYDDDSVGEFMDENIVSIMKQALLPDYDGKEQWSKVLAGTAKAFVPSHNILCENADDGSVHVFVSGIYTGRVRGSIIKASKKNIPIIENIVRKYAS